MAESPSVKINVELKSGKNCPHREVERVRAAQLKTLCPLCVFADLLASTMKAKTLGMKPDVPGPLELGLPLPPAPPLEIRRSGLFGGEVETPESRLARARYEGSAFMWRKFIEALYPGDEKKAREVPSLPDPELRPYTL